MLTVVQSADQLIFYVIFKDAISFKLLLLMNGRNVASVILFLILDNCFLLILEVCNAIKLKLQEMMEVLILLLRATLQAKGVLGKMEG